MSKQATLHKVPVSERALYQRINRKLKSQHEMLCAARSLQVERDCGRHFVVDTYRNAIARVNVDLDALGRELSVLAAWEELAFASDQETSGE